jgi:hypothetical protein
LPTAAAFVVDAVFAQPSTTIIARQHAEQAQLGCLAGPMPQRCAPARCAVGSTRHGVLLFRASSTAR